MSSKTLYLVRHAKPDYPNGERMCMGQKLDLPLSDFGQEQARLLGERFVSRPIQAVFTSPLRRARQTAGHIAGGRPLYLLDDLRELDGGEWDGRPFSEIHAQYPEFFLPGSSFSCPPGGETDEQGLARAQAALTYVFQHTAGDSVMVAHSGINRLLLCALLGKPLRAKKQIPQDYAAVNVLEYTNGAWTVKEINLPCEAL